MTLMFLGTRGNIDVRSRRHRRHTSTLASHQGRTVMIDCGADWLRSIAGIKPAIVAGPPDVERRVSELGQAHRIQTQVAYDGLRIMVR